MSESARCLASVVARKCASVDGEQGMDIVSDRVNALLVSGVVCIANKSEREELCDRLSNTYSEGACKAELSHAPALLQLRPPSPPPPRSDFYTVPLQKDR